MHQALVAQVVQAALLEDLGAGLEPHSLTELDAGGLGLWDEGQGRMQ